MKSYVTSGTGSQQTLTGSQDEKVAVYQTLADAEADLANLEAGQIVATPDTGDEYAQPVDVVESDNMHAVTSNAVAGAIASLEPQQKSLDIDTLYPSENGKIENYFGNFSGNVPESRNTATLKVIRVKGSDGVQIYQEWECYSDSSTNYAPNKYIRFGYIPNGSTLTWSSWNKLITGSDLGISYNDNSPVDISSQVTKNLGAGSILAFRKNNLVIIRIEGVYSGIPTTSAQSFISGLPSKYRPSLTQYCCGLAYKNGDSMVYPCRLSVFANGSIEMSETAFPNGSQLRICMFYMI